MRTPVSTRCGLLAVAAAILAGCSSARPAAAPGMLPATAAVPVSKRDESWMLPAATGKDLLYSAGGRDNMHVYVFTYPDGKRVGRLGGFWDPGTAMCVDSLQNVWISNGNPGEMIEYAHGGSQPLATLADAYGLPTGCSVDSTTGNLAVANEFGSSSGPYSSILVYPNGQGTPTVYTINNYEYINGCAYDGSGNLYAIGWIYNKGTHMAVLPAGGSQFKELNFTGSLTAGWLQWRGTDLYAGNYPSAVDQLAVNGSNVTVKKTITLDESKNAQDFFVNGSTIIAHVLTRYGAVGFWKLPAGGNPVKIIPDAPHEKGFIQYGVAVSLAGSR
ncbi:MAG TPA: hypothetical protein VGI19_03625 [Candidatus Cybelea sp.]|jgi:hypothetical protein